MLMPCAPLVVVVSQMITRALEGNYVNFGVFALYGDKVWQAWSQVWGCRFLCVTLRAHPWGALCRPLTTRWTSLSS